MILFGIPQPVQRSFDAATRRVSRPIRRAPPMMVLAFLLAPHRRCLKTVAGIVLGRRVHASTISRRLRNAAWRTRDWFVDLFDRCLTDVLRYEQHATPGPRRGRSWIAVVDTTYHGTHSEHMENLILMSRRRDPSRNNVRQHAFVLGLLITETGMRLPLPRRSYYTKEYCSRHRRRYRTQVQLAASMIEEIPVPEGIRLAAVFDSAFDANAIHRACRRCGFSAVLPLDPNRTLSSGSDVEASGLRGQKVVSWTRTWSRDEFTLLALQHANEDHVLIRRRHRDNLRRSKTQRRYAIAARQATVSSLGTCKVVASYKENPRIELVSGQSADWWDYHRASPRLKRHGRPAPRRWHGKVLACTDPTATARQVVEQYEVRWQIELFFRELKSRMQFGCYVLKEFAAVERYLDLLLMGFLVLEQERLREMRASPSRERGEGDLRVHSRTTDRLRALEAHCHQWNLGTLERRLRTAQGRERLLRELRDAAPCHVA